MKLPLSAGSPDAAPELAKPSLPATWLILHALFCATSMAVGFRFSRLVVFLLFLPTPPMNPSAHLVSLVTPPVMLASSNTTATITTTTTTTTTVTTTTTLAESEAGANAHHQVHHGPVFVGRHAIRVRKWPHPNPGELLKAHSILAAVQEAQRRSRNRMADPLRPVIAVTPTTTSALQAPSLTSLAHTLRLVDAPLRWIVVEPGHRTDAVAAVLARSGLDFLHLVASDGASTARLRMHALREVRKEKMDGVVVFADENGILRTELFDEAQKVKSVGAVPVGILGEDEGTKESFLQAPACDEAGKLVGYHVSEETLLPAARSDMLLSTRLEWAGFVVNARVLWESASERPEWVRDLDAVDGGAHLDSPLGLVTDAGQVEPLARCARAALAWSLRSDALHEVKFPHEWKFDAPLVSAASRQQSSVVNTEDGH